MSDCSCNEIVYETLDLVLLPPVYDIDFALSSFSKFKGDNVIIYVFSIERSNFPLKMKFMKSVHILKKDAPVRLSHAKPSELLIREVHYRGAMVPRM